MGEVLGGRVVPSEPPEIGVLDINIIDDAKQDPVFNFLPNSIKALQWHSYEVQGLETIDGVEVIGSSLQQNIKFLDTIIMPMVFNFILKFENQQLMIGQLCLNTRMR